MASGATLRRFVVDASNQVLDTFASIAMEDLLNGKPKEVVVLSCEKFVLSGDIDSLKIKYSSFQGLTPCEIVRETMRGLIPHESEKGEDALARLELHEGVPPPYEDVPNKEKLVIRAALRDPKCHKKYYKLGRLCSKLVGSRYDAIWELKKKRKDRSCERTKRSYKLRGIGDDAKKLVDTETLTSQLMLFHLQPSTEEESSSHPMQMT